MIKNGSNIHNNTKGNNTDIYPFFNAMILKIEMKNTINNTEHEIQQTNFS